MIFNKEKIKTISIILLVFIILSIGIFAYLKPQYDNSILQKGYNSGVYGLSYEQAKSGNFYFVTPDNNVTYLPLSQICSQIQNPK